MIDDEMLEKFRALTLKARLMEAASNACYHLFKPGTPSQIPIFFQGVWFQPTHPCSYVCSLCGMRVNLDELLTLKQSGKAET